MYYNNNMTGLFNLLMAMDASGVNNIIYSSSATVYGSNPFSTEGDKIQPFNPYGQTKAMAE
jgi:UDP-glucose 4-epimerase